MTSKAVDTITADVEHFRHIEPIYRLVGGFCQVNLRVKETNLILDLAIGRVISDMKADLNSYKPIVEEMALSYKPVVERRVRGRS